MSERQSQNMSERQYKELYIPQKLTADQTLTHQTLSHQTLSHQTINKQIARILDEDYSHFENAIQSKIQSIDQCLTSRSNFLSMFQQMLKKQMGLQEQPQQFQNREDDESSEFSRQQLHDSKFKILSNKLQLNQNIPKDSFSNNPLPFFAQSYSQVQLKQSQLQTPRQLQLQTSFNDTNKQIWQSSSFGFTSRQSKCTNHIQITRNKLKMIDKSQNLVKFTTIFSYILQKTTQMSQQIRQVKHFYLEQINKSKIQLKQLVSNSLYNIVEIINSIYQKKVQQLIEQTQKFKSQTIRLKQQISFRNLANSSCLEQNYHDQSPFPSKLQLKESQRYDFLQNTFANIPLPQIKFSYCQLPEKVAPKIQSQQKQYNFTIPQIKRNKVYEAQYKQNQNNLQNTNNFKQIKYKNFYEPKEALNDKFLVNNYQFMEKPSQNNSSLYNFNSFFSENSNQPHKNQWKQIKFSLKKDQKQNKLCKDKNLYSKESKQTTQKKSYNNFYDFQPLKKLEIKYPPILDGHASISQSDLFYKGNWKNGLMHGKGKLSTNIFDYEGEFWYGSFQGKGTYRTKILQYDGQFKNNMINGKGILLMKNERIQGVWKQNKFMRRA